LANEHKKRKRKIKKAQQEQLQLQRDGRKKIRHNTAASQEKHRPDWRPLQPDELGTVPARRIMPRDEQSRRATLEAKSDITLSAEFDDGLWTRLAAETPHKMGTVLEVSQGLCRVMIDGREMPCDIRGILSAEGTGYTNIVAVGDRVLVQPLAANRGLIEEILPRRSGLARADSFYSHLKQIIAANVDQLLIVASWREPQIWLELIDEYLIGAARNNLAAIICVNKIDLADSVDTCREAIRAYASLGHRLIFTSALDGRGLSELRAVLLHKSTVLAGLSGVGKSSLLMAIDPALNLRVGEINQKRQQGRHTTTQANMLLLSEGGCVIDTPGIREFGIKGLPQSELISFYPDIAEVLDQCRFNDCTHSHEPGCAVKQAVSSGRIADWRYQNYVNIFQKLAD